MDTTTETTEQPDSAALPPTATAPLGETHPQAREEQPKPPTLNALLVERMERIEDSVSSVAQDVGYYGQESITALAKIKQQGNNQDFYQRLILIVLFALVFFFGVFIGVGVFLAIRG